MFKTIITLFGIIGSMAMLHAQCPAGQTPVRLEINPDMYFNEVTWTITNNAGTEVYASGGCTTDALATFEYCVPADVCAVFRIKDQYGDGIAPDGYYRLYVNDTLVHENLQGAYGFGESVAFNCPPGSNCDQAFPLNLGMANTPDDQETWYVFTPVDTGKYKITTCGLDNACPTKIWVYDRCQGIVVTDNQTGATFYSDGGCNDGAEAVLYLAGGQTYYIRLANTTGACAGLPIQFQLSFEGPIQGCLDPLSCNYNPLATIADTCIYFGDPGCTNAPDLEVEEDVLRSTMIQDFIPISDQCTVDEGCLRGVNNRHIIRFSTHIKNIGNADYFIGGPPTDINTPSTQFVFDPCHNHWHYRGYAEYVLYDANGQRVPVGSKNGFCVLDLECSGGGAGKYTCGNMGVTHGCGDIYDAQLPCQWIDITDIPAGTYTFVMRVNWDRSPDAIGRYESNYDNNWAQACFQLTYDDENLPVVQFVDDCPQYTDCLGVLFGDAQTDCEGTCNGAALRGDWNKDATRNQADVQAYIAESLANNNTPTECQDLHDNGSIDVYDAALLQECNLHGDEVDYWGNRFACQFPTGIDNEKDIVYLLPGTLDTVAKTFDVQLVNPYNKIIGYEFSVSGLEIESVENMVQGFDATVQFGAGGAIIALSGTEQYIKKNILPAKMVRVHYKKLIANKVCVENITAVVNQKYQRSNAILADPNCVNIGVSSAQDLAGNGFGAFANPNPFQGSTAIFFPNPASEPVNVTLSDWSGRIVRTFSNVRSESVVIERGNLSAGIYQFTVSNGNARASGKVVVL